MAAHRLDVDAAQLCGRGGAERAGVRGGRLRRQQQALPLLRRGLRPGEGHLAPGETIDTEEEGDDTVSTFYSDTIGN